MSTNPNPQIKPGTILVSRDGGVEVSLERNRRNDWWLSSGQWIPAAALAGRLTDGTWTAYTPEQLVAALGIGQDSAPVAPESDANPTSAPAVPLDQEIELQPLIVGPQFVRVDPRLWVNPTLVFAIRTLEGSNGCRMYGSGGHVVDVDAPVDEVLDLLTGGDQ